MYFFFFFLSKKKNVILFKEREKERKKMREKYKVAPVGKKEKKKFSLVNGSYNFQLIYKKTIQ